MSSLPNYKARLERANRNNVPVQSATDSFKKFKWFTTFLVIFFPIYPSLAAIGTASQTAVGDYDESSIITAFNDTEGLEYISEKGIVTVGGDKDIKPLPSEELEKTETPIIPQSNVKTYTVVEYDDIIKIAKKYNLDPEVILWSNNLSMNDTLKVGQVLRIPPVAGLVHILQPGETVSDIAKKYNVSSAEILATNNISDARKIPDGAKLMIPGAKKPEPKPVVEKPAEKKVETPQKTVAQAPATTAKPVATRAAEKPAEKKVETPAVPASTTVNANTGLKDRYAIKFTGLGRGFVAGNCTWHVARNKTVTWRGNANQWIKNARAQGVPTGKTPVIGAIVQFSGHGYNAYYGHVGIVTDIQDGNLIVSDMNYRGLYEITIRKVPMNHPAIDGYIYVD